jgi:hypothetical protein
MMMISQSLLEPGLTHKTYTNSDNSNGARLNSLRYYNHRLDQSGGAKIVSSMS